MYGGSLIVFNCFMKGSLRIDPPKLIDLKPVPSGLCVFIEVDEEYLLHIGLSLNVLTNLSRVIHIQGIFILLRKISCIKNLRIIFIYTRIS
ncbi:hypothetical protein HanPI659440_Chr06g0224581 [Helianthus annuus]|nr:hypothetical protein HanPI659440_Chr06g0224581 [Helianthus annuus]